MGIDPRGPRVGALITTAVFIAVLITSNVWLLAAQGVVFAIAAIFGMKYAPYGLLYRFAIRPRLGPPKELEAPAPPRFAQGVGLAFAVIGDKTVQLAVPQSLIGDHIARRGALGGRHARLPQAMCQLLGIEVSGEGREVGIQRRRVVVPFV